MRVVGGALRGRSLSGFRGSAIRPTSDRVREVVFNVLASRGFFGARPVVLDLYAGTGALGIEALSRGAERAVFVDSAAVAARLIKKNLSRFGLEDRAVVLQMDVLRAIGALGRRGERFDIVFVDPPYAEGVSGEVLRDLDGVLAKGAVVVAEGPRGAPLDPSETGLAVLDEKVYGDTAVFFLGRHQDS